MVVKFMNHFKVKSKEESSQKHLRPSPTLAAPLASTESLTPSESTTGSSTIKRISSSVTGDSVSTVVHKPYEPPTLGKSSRDLYYKLSYALTGDENYGFTLCSARFVALMASKHQPV